MRRVSVFKTSRRSQLGFSMVEMLMAAFILAIGILGLAALQTMSIRSATGSRGLTTAVLVAEQVLDQIEANGRNTLLYARNEPQTIPTAVLTSVFLAAPVAPPAAPNLTYNFAGRPSVGDPIDNAAFFRVYIAPGRDPLADPGVVAPVTGLGGIANMVVTVQWVEDGTGVARQVVLSRRVAYATA